MQRSATNHIDTTIQTTFIFILHLAAQHSHDNVRGGNRAVTDRLLYFYIKDVENFVDYAQKLEKTCIPLDKIWNGRKNATSLAFIQVWSRSPSQDMAHQR